MKKFIPKMSPTAGLAPGSLLYTGKYIDQDFHINLINYTKSELVEKEITDIRDLQSTMDSQVNSWIQVEGINDVVKMQELGDFFEIHPLVLEDILNIDQRPKAEHYEDMVFITLRMLFFNEKTTEISEEQISFLVRPSFLISFHENTSEIFFPIVKRLRNEKSRTRQKSISYLLYVLLDSLIDQYLVALEKIGQTIEDLDRRVIKKHTEVHLNKLHHLKKELLLFRKITTPVPELLLHIRSKEFEKDSGHATVPYWQDLYDHALQVSELVKTYSDILNGIFDLYFSLVSTKTNQIVQALTVITIVFMPLTLLAGIYGMNFKYMPELQWKWGYPGVIAFMISIGVFLLLLFRKKKWF